MAILGAGSEKEGSTMCPCCERGYLQPVGSLLACDICGLAITQEALEIIRAHEPPPTPELERLYKTARS